MIPLWSRTPGWVASGATLDMDFADGLYYPSPLSSLLTTTRASTGYGQTVAGTLTNFLANTSRITNLGDTVEPARTNLLLRSDDLSNAAWFTGGANPTVVSTNNVAPDGTATATRLTFGNAGAAATRQLVTVTNNQPVVMALYVKAAPSSAAANIRICTNNSNDWNTGGDAVLALTSSWQRIPLTFQNTFGTSVAVYFGAQKSDSSEDATCKGDALVWGADFNANNTVMLSHISTLGVTATRAADSAVVSIGNVTRIVFTFSDATTQTISGITPNSPYTIPTNLNKPVIARLTGYAT